MAPDERCDEADPVSSLNPPPTPKDVTRDLGRPASPRNRNQAEDPIAVAALTLIVREADAEFERVGGSSRHWVRDCFLPTLNKHGWFVDAVDPQAANGDGHKDR